MAQDAELAKELPLTGVILCCTSILAEHRSQLTDIASQMGAIHKFDLTSDVTHLIVGDVNTPKYKYVAKERNDVKVLRAEWVEAVRSSWILGGDTDTHALELEYRLPTFFGLSICITGFDDTDYRNRLQATIVSNGGEFRKDLTKAVTHLVARGGNGQKYKFAIQWGLKVVSEKWLEDSVHRTMVLDESLYDPLVPIEKQGIGAWKKATPIIPETTRKPQEANHQRSRKLRRVASIKLGGQTESIWSALVPTPSMVLDRNNGSQYDGSQQLAGNLRQNLPDTKSFVSETTHADRHDSIPHDAKPSPALPPEVAQQLSKGFWDNCRFYITGFKAEQTRVLESHLLAQDALISPSLDDLMQHDNQLFVIVPYNLPRREIVGMDEDMDELEVVTDMWIERCLRNQAFIAPEAHITSTPFPKFPIPAFSGMRICSTGFTGIDLLHLCKLVNLLGATYDEYLTSEASVLICNTANPNPDKLRHVFQWDIPPVIADWLWISVQTGEKKPYQPYLILDKRSISHGDRSQHVSHPTKNRPNSPMALHEHPADHSSAHPLSECIDHGVIKTVEADDSDNQTATLKELSTNLPVKPSRSPSPLKEPTPSISSVSQIHIQPPDAISKSPVTFENNIRLNTAISELLKQKRSRNQQSNVGTDAPARTQRRRKLFGRASSSCSALTDLQRGVSRASSIDTLNEDGHGSIVEGLESPSGRTPSNAPSFISMVAQKQDVSRPEQVEAQQMLQRRLALFQSNSASGEFSEKRTREDEPLPSTQLGYEDPDALAMREMISNSTQKPNQAEEGSNGQAGRKLVIGKIQDGRASGRRTRSRKLGG